MNIEQRLSDHMAEQAERLTFETPDPAAITDRPPSGPNRTVSILAAAVVIVAAGFGFWALSRGGGGTTEIAAGETDDADADTDSVPASDVGLLRLSVTDVSSADSPGHGRVEVDNGVYYVLSTAPGRVSLDESFSEEEWLEAYRPSTFYSFDGGGWKIAEVEDRFISDFDVDGGLLYVLSTGTLTGDGSATLGTSSDQGQTWDWQPVPDLPEANQVGILADGPATVIMANRWGYPDYDEVLGLARGAGFDVTERTLRDFDHDGFAYMDVDADDPCAAVMVDYGLSDLAMWLREAEHMDDEAALRDANMELEHMLEQMGPELEASGCELDFETIADLPEPERVRWADIGVAVPERWHPWTGLYRYENGVLTELDRPFDTDHQIGIIETRGGRLTVSTWDRGGEEEGDEGAETIWSTTDGIDWESETIRYSEYEERGYYHAPGYSPPIAGDSTFRVWWDEEEMIAFEEEMMAYEEAGAEGPADTILREPGPQLQRSVSGGPWENVDLAELAPDVDLGGKFVQDVRGTPYGVFLVFGSAGGYSGPPEPGLLVLHSNNGIEWGSFESPGNMLEVVEGPDSLLLFDHTWSNEPEEPAKTRTLVVTPAS